MSTANLMIAAAPKDALGLEPAGRNATVKERGDRAAGIGMEPPVVTGGLAKPIAANETFQPNPVASGSPPLTSGGSTYPIIGGPEDLDGARQLSPQRQSHSSKPRKWRVEVTIREV